MSSVCDKEQLDEVSPADYLGVLRYGAARRSESSSKRNFYGAYAAGWPEGMPGRAVTRLNIKVHYIMCVQFFAERLGVHCFHWLSTRRQDIQKIFSESDSSMARIR